MASETLGKCKQSVFQERLSWIDITDALTNDEARSDEAPDDTESRGT